MVTENNILGGGFIVFDSLFDQRIMKCFFKGQEYYWKYKINVK